jgi:hypothetical protein
VTVRFEAVAFLLTLACSAACSSAGSDSAPREPTWLDAPTAELPRAISELGLYKELPSRTRVHERTVPYRPLYELWSNGTAKDRYLFLPAGTAIDTSQHGAWSFPLGTLLFKTFSASLVTSAGVTDAQPIETRVLQLAEEGWQYAVYSWSEDGRDAELADLSSTRAVTVEIDGDRFDHVVPAKLDCRKCHESDASPVLGFDELDLTVPYAADAPSQLATLHEAGLLSELAEDPERIVHDDPTTERVLAYLQGNCVHCHNGGDGASSAFDLRHDVALDNLIGRETQGESIAGIRVVPGEPQNSALYLAMSRVEGGNDVQAMPPVGVQRADESALDLFEHWIEELRE